MRRKIFKSSLFLSFIFLAGLFLPVKPAHAAMEEYPVVKLRSLDKISARTMTFEARVGSTVKFGPIYIKIQTCRKAPPIEQPEAAAFLQIWEVTPQEEAKWVFSGWMFASSPALSSMDHPVYDVWVIDCLEQKSGEEPTEAAADTDETTEASAAPSDEQEESQITPETSLEAEVSEEQEGEESSETDTSLDEGASVSEETDEEEALFAPTTTEEDPFAETAGEEQAPVPDEYQEEANGVSKRIYATSGTGNGTTVTIQPDTLRKPVRDGIISETLPPPPEQN